MKVIEFFSGIGGMHTALKNACKDVCIQVKIDILQTEHTIQMISAWDMNCTANTVYKHNHNILPCNKSIEQVTVDILDGYADMWLLSPPCQPYTRALEFLLTF